MLVLAIVHVALPIDLGCLDMNAWLCLVTDLNEGNNLATCKVSRVPTLRPWWR